MFNYKKQFNNSEKLCKKILIKKLKSKIKRLRQKILILELGKKSLIKNLGKILSKNLNKRF